MEQRFVIEPEKRQIVLLLEQTLLLTCGDLRRAGMARVQTALWWEMSIKGVFSSE